MDTISLIVPTYPAREYFGACLTSIQKSTYKNIEILVIDDGGHAELLDERIEEDDRIRVLPQPRGPLAACWNLGLAEAFGPMIAFVAPKDMLGRMRLELQVNRLLQQPDVGLSYCGMTFIDTEGDFLKGVHLAPTFQERRFLATMYHTNQIGAISTVLLWRHVLEDIGGFDETLALHEDYDMWLRLAQSCPIDYLDLPLVRYRVLPQAPAINGAYENRDEIARILNKFDRGDIARVLGQAFDTEETFRLALGVVLSRRGEEKEAIGNFQKVLEINPDNSDVRFHLGNHHYRMESPDESARWYLENLEQNPDHAETRNNLGVLLYQRGQLAGCRTEFHKAQQLKKDYQDPVHNLHCVEQKNAITAMRVTLVSTITSRNISSPAQVG